MTITLEMVIQIIGVILLSGLGFLAKNAFTAIVSSSKKIDLFDHKLDHLDEKIDKLERALSELTQVRDMVMKHQAQLERVWAVLERMEGTNQQIWEIQRKRDHWYKNELQILRGCIELLVDESQVKIKLQEPKEFPQFDESWFSKSSLRKSN